MYSWEKSTYKKKSFEYRYICRKITPAMVNSILHFAGDQTGHLQIQLQLGGHGREGRKTKGKKLLHIGLISVAKKKKTFKVSAQEKIYSSKPDKWDI